MNKEPLSAARLRELVHYDPETGVFTSLCRRGSSVSAGMVLGSPAHFGYLRMTIDGKHYYAHRLAWLYMTGEWPERLIDHKQGKSNRFSNLRCASDRVNCENQSRARSNSKSGILGVSWSEKRKRWCAYICVRGKEIGLGRFTSQEEARQRYIDAKRALHEGCLI